MLTVGIDPGQQGAVVALDSVGSLWYWRIPLTVSKDLDHFALRGILAQAKALKHTSEPIHVYLERAMALAMGSSSALSYGRHFASIELAVTYEELPVTYVLPKEWNKVMFEGTSADLKPKVRAVIAVERLFPMLIDRIPKNKNGKLHEGIVDALLLAGYGVRRHK